MIIQAWILHAKQNHNMIFLILSKEKKLVIFTSGGLYQSCIVSTFNSFRHSIS